jgi:hypothetical protein
LHDTDPLSDPDFPEKVIINLFAITCVSLKNSTVTCKTSTDTFTFKRKDSDSAAAFFKELSQKIVNVNKFDQDGRLSDIYNNYDS